jgi:hypothetical protein
MTGETSDPYPTEEDVEAVLEEFGGHAREAIRALLHDLAVLAADYESSVSKGFIRGSSRRTLTMCSLRMSREYPSP